jgi:thermostable 8-oxoguanine DNA glycosylase
LESWRYNRVIGSPNLIENRRRERYSESEMQQPTRANDYEGDLSEFLKKYNFQPELTRKLDDLEDVKLSPELLNKIVLWKLNRYVSLNEDQLLRIDAVRNLKPGEHEQARPVLEDLLKAHGVDVPMASTFLRFRNPFVFQIIDRHAYRALYGQDYKLYPQTSVKKKIDAYVAYLDDLRRLCYSKGLVFHTVDRVLYVFDKEANGSLSKEKNAG